jgi:DNA helicase-4
MRDSTFLLSIAVIIAMVVLSAWIYNRIERNKKEAIRVRELALEEERKAELDREVKEQERIQKHREYIIQERARRQACLHSFASEITNGANEAHLLQLGYIALFPFTEWRQTYSFVGNEVKDLRSDDLSIAASFATALSEFRQFFAFDEVQRRQHNEKIVEMDLVTYRNLLDTAAGLPLDDQQRRAVLTDEDNNLVIAGAGSGKTTTIVGKVKYVIERYKIRPNRILLITFTNKSAQTLVEKVAVKDVVAKTFHSFCLRVVSQVQGHSPSTADAADFELRIKTLFENRFRNDKDYKAMAAAFFVEGLKIEKADDDFKSKGEYIQYLKEQNFKPIKAVLVNNKGKQTFKRETVKSKEECKIADFLYLNNIDYTYEAAYEHPTATSERQQYRPDFTIRQNGKVIYLEHFGTNAKGEVPKWFAKKDTDYSWQVAKDEYKKGMKWKRDIHNQYGTRLIETYSYQNDRAEGLMNALATGLQLEGIELYPKTPEEIWAIIKREDEHTLKSFTKLLCTFINLTKSNNIGFDDVRKRINEIKQEGERLRAERFCEIIEPVFNDYQSYLSSNSLIDFNDMINLAIEFINEGRYEKTFDYIIIDEFQDTSISRYKLVEALKKRNPFCKLFCVGDDWQSIFRFAGSDIALFREFESYFGETQKLKIETTYRYHEPLIRLSGDFILKNKNQSVKTLVSGSPGRSTTYQIIYFEEFVEGQEAINKLDELVRTLQMNLGQDIEKKTILLLGRYNFDKKIFDKQPYTLSGESDPEPEIPSVGTFSIANTRGDNPETWVTYSSIYGTVKMQFMSVHKSKGLEADIVILLNCSSGSYGFPAQLSDDPILNLLLSDADQFENGEERRLFYVAMTRAKEQVYFLTDRWFKSKFITEFELAEPDKKLTKCPNCREGDLILRSGTYNSFYGCSNYSYGCDYRKSANLR